MAYRSFRDSVGMEWEAWDVVPRLVERRTADRRAPSGRAPFVEHRLADRRVADGRRATLGSGLGQGWLCFENPAEKRRLAPIPPDWTDCCDASLEEYCRQARVVRAN